MSIIVTNGTVIYNTGKTSVSIKASDGPQTLPDEIEARLVTEGVASYVNKPAYEVATPPENQNDKETGANLPNSENGSEGARLAQDKPEYSIDMKAAELRELMEDCGLTYKVGMTKADMVAALDVYFEEEAEDENTEGLPNLGAEEPIV